MEAGSKSGAPKGLSGLPRIACAVACLFGACALLYRALYYRRLGDPHPLVPSLLCGATAVVLVMVGVSICSRQREVGPS